MKLNLLKKRWAFLVTPVNVYLSLCNCVMASTGAI
jgi:hypothetical protein